MLTYALEQPGVLFIIKYQFVKYQYTWKILAMCQQVKIFRSRKISREAESAIDSNQINLIGHYN